VVRFIFLSLPELLNSFHSNGALFYCRKRF
jgi:hypothetical protein